ncbi:MAG: hypothetical protein D8H94_14910 [Cardiobacterium sp.]|nr:MAG: hypothetical protein D8H94_14910 [Cardiobacterium sp.]
MGAVGIMMMFSPVVGLMSVRDSKLFYIFFSIKSVTICFLDVYTYFNIWKSFIFYPPRKDTWFQRMKTAFVRVLGRYSASQRACN